MRLCVRIVRGLVVASAILGGVFFASAVIGVGTAGSALAQASAVVVEGNRRVEADTVRSYFKPGPGGRLDAVQIDEGLKALYATGLFQDVRTNQGAGGRLVVTVVENPVINRVAFEGNKKTKDDQLNAEVQSKSRGTLSRPTVQADVQRIIEIYRRNGRFDVRVDPKIIDLPNNRVDLVFEINEGDKTGVKTINFVGNKTYSGSRLLDIVKTSESNLLSFLQTTDIYDPDRIEADRDLLRRFYLKNGYADVRIVSAIGEYDPAKKGFVVTFTIDEGGQYRVGTLDVVSNVRAVEPASLRSKLRLGAGDVYNVEAVEKSIEGMTIEASKRGYAFATVRPRGDRNFETKTINLAFVVEEGPRAYIERINIRGNGRTRDYVIRREFDIGEGDAYNRALVDRAERRLKNLNYFKSVKITNEPGSAPDRVVLNVDVEEMSTGEFSVAGGYSTADGFLGEVSVGERNLLGRGQYAKASLTYGQRARGLELSFAEPYFLGYRVSSGIDLFAKQTFASSYVSYDTETLGTSLRLGFGLSEEIALQTRYSIYQQRVTLPDALNNCQNTPEAMAFRNGIGPGVQPGNACFADNEASLSIRKELAQGAVVTSLLGYSLAYNTLDNNKNPTTGLYAELKQDFAGVGGDVNFIRSSIEARTYREILPDVIGVLRLQAGQIESWGGKDLRMLDHFQLGPTLVRGFAPAGIGPRDLTPGTTQDALGGTMYWGGSLEAQTPLYFLPKEIGIKVAAFVDAGSLWSYKGPRSWATTGETLQVADDSSIRSSVGAGLIWDSPFGPLRFDLAYPITKESYDRTQIFRFGGGPSSDFSRPAGCGCVVMTGPLFLRQTRGLTIGEAATMTGAEPLPGAQLDALLCGIAPLERAGPADLSFLDNPKYAGDFGTTLAGACFTSARFEKHAPPRVSVLRSREPYRAFVTVARALFPDALRPSSLLETKGFAGGSLVHPAARVESGVTIEHGAVVGPRAEIGSGTVIGPNAVIGPDVRIGRDSFVGAGATIVCALIGDRVILHSGCRIGQDGFGYLPGAKGHTKIPQIGRVIIQDDVEIGANTTIDRGGTRDTVIGEGTKIDNLVQIAHNVQIGRHCFLVSQTGIAGSVTVGDYAMMGGQVGIGDHINIGAGAAIAARAGVMGDVPPGVRWAGAPAKPLKKFFREMVTLQRLAERDEKGETEVNRSKSTDDGASR